MNIEQLMINKLEDELANIAMAFRGAPQDSEERDSIAERYRSIMEQIFVYEDWCGEPEVESQLPDEYMPDVYKEYWKNKLGDW